MKNRIDLSNFNIRTDLIIDNKIYDEYLQKNIINDNLNITTLIVDEKLKTKLNKTCGTYITIEFTDITNHEDKLEVEKYLKKIK